MNGVVKQRDPLTEEIKAIATVGRALARIEDPVARLRVLHWAVETFHPDAVTQAPVAPPRAADPALAIGSLEDLFETDAPRPTPAPAMRRKAPAESLIRRFVADCRRVVIQWQGV